MYLSELFRFEGKFNKKDRVFTLSFEIPEASDIWALFERKTVSNITKQIDHDLLKRFDAVFTNPYFMFLFKFPGVDSDDEEDIDLAYTVESSIFEYKKGRESPEFLGTWEYSRKDRLVSLVWNVPEWFQEPAWAEGKTGLFYTSSFEVIHNLCKDWYINSP